MKKINLCTLQIPLDVVELIFTGSRSMSCSKTKPTLEKQQFTYTSTAVLKQFYQETFYIYKIFDKMFSL